VRGAWPGVAVGAGCGDRASECCFIALTGVCSKRCWVAMAIRYDAILRCGKQRELESHLITECLFQTLNLAIVLRFKNIRVGRKHVSLA